MQGTGLVLCFHGMHIVDGGLGAARGGLADVRGVAAGHAKGKLVVTI
jgi:hypothetical protein